MPIRSYTDHDKIAYQLAPDDIWVPLGAQAHRKLGNVIYRYRPDVGQERMAYYIPTNPRTRDQQAWRSVYADAVAAWQALSDNDKDTWRARATRSYLNGYCLFLQDYLLTHTPTAYYWTVATTLITSTDYISAYQPITIDTWKIGDPSYVKGPIATYPMIVGLYTITNPRHTVG